MNPQIDNKVMKLLEVETISHFIADTSKGRLSLLLRKGEYEYCFVLDAVPVDDETNDTLRELYHNLF